MATKARRVTRRPVEEGALAKQDELAAATNKAMAFINQNRRPLVLGSALTLLVIVATVAFNHYYTSRGAERSSLFASAVKDSVAAVETTKADADDAAEDNPLAPAKKAPAAKSSSGDKYTSYADRATAASGKYENFLKEYGSGSGMPTLARAALGSLALDQGKTDEILKGYPELLKDSELAPQLRFFLLDSLATAQVQTKDVAAADKTYQEMDAVQGGLYADYAAFRRGQLAEAQGKKDEARQTYRAALEKHPHGAYQDEIQKRLDLL